MTSRIHSVHLFSDNMLVVAGLGSLLKKIQGIELVSTSPSSELSSARQLKDQDAVILADYPSVKNIIGFGKIALLDNYPSILIFTPSDSNEIFRAVKSGFRAFVGEHFTESELTSSIVNVTTNAIRFSDALIVPVLEKLSLSSSGKVSVQLTGREISIIQGVASGKTNSEIAVEIGLSAKTVDTHRTRVMKKIGVNSIAGVVHFALKNGYVQ